MEDFFTSTEFYVAAITAGILLFIFFLSPSSKGEAYTYFFKGYKYPSAKGGAAPQLIIEGMDDGSLKLMHTRAEMSANAQLSLVVTVSGSDIKITEKVDENSLSALVEDYDVAYYITCLKNQRYHLYFESTHTEMWVSSSLINNPDFHTIVDLKL